MSSMAVTNAATGADERATSRIVPRATAPAPARRASRLVNSCTASTSTAGSMAQAPAAGLAGHGDIVPRRMTSVVAQMRRARRLRRLGSLEWFEIAYRVYLAALIGGGVVLWLSGLVSDDPATASQIAALNEHGAALAIAFGLRSGSDGGPVSIEPPDVRHLLLAPVPRRQVLTRPVVQRLRS